MLPDPILPPRTNHRQSPAGYSYQELEHDVFTSLATGLAVVAPDGRWLKVNPALCKMVGYSEAELLEMTLFELTHADDAVISPAQREKAFATDEPLNFDKRYIHKDGSIVWVNVISTLKRNEQGDPLYFISQITDISERRRNGAMLEAAFDFAPIGKALVSSDGSIFKVNDAVCKMLGYRRKELVGGTLADITHPDDLTIDMAYLQELVEGERTSYTMEKRYFHKDGSLIWGKLSVSAIYTTNGEVAFVVGQVEDITEMVAARALLEQRAAQLEKSNRNLQEFAYVASHDLQEPLRMITSYVQLLDRRYGDKLDERAKDYIGFAVDGARRSKELINALLSFSRVDTQSLELTATDLNRTLKLALANLKPVISDKGATVHSDALPEVRGSGVLLTQVFQNLLGNGLKFRGDRAPELHVSALDQGEMWEIRVKDNGIGIAPEYLNKIFTIFSRLHTRDAYEGTGIGLALCRRIVERHGGVIGVESVPGEGSTFYFTLPK